MSPCRSFGSWYEAPPRQPVPAEGIATRRFGATWWGREWIASLERLDRAWSSRLPRGRSYARQGRVVDLEVGAGVITAGVVGTRRRPYRVAIRLPIPDPEAWRRGLERLAGDLLVVIRLLERDLPDEVAEVLGAAGVGLFPARGELRTRCSCPDVANPCKHVAAVHYVVAAALDYDPFLLLRLRGLAREDLLAVVAGEAPAETDGGPAPAAGEAEHGVGESGSGLDVAGFLGRDLAPPVLDLAPRPPAVPLVGIRRLGPPPRGLERLPDLLAPAIRAAGRRALQLAWGEEVAVERGAVAPAGSEPTGTPSAAAVAPEAAHRALVRRVEAAVTDAPGGLLRRELIERTGAEAAAVTAALRELRSARLVVTRGRGSGTRYRAAPRAAPVRGGGRPAVVRAERGDPATRVVAALQAARTALPLRTLAERLGATPDELRPVLLALRQNGVVEMIGRRRAARYRLVC